MPLPAKRQGTHLQLVISNDHVVPGGTPTNLHFYNPRMAFPLVVDSVPADHPFNTLMDALNGVRA